MKKIVLGLIVLVLLAVVGAFFYVSSIDWNQHKDKIAKQFYNISGKHISFDGKVSFEIFPSPYLKAVNAKVYNDDNKSETPLLDIKNVVAELSLMPLLRGEFDVKKMILDGVVINIDWDNGLNWQSDLSEDQRMVMEDTKMVLNGVSLKNAHVNFEAKESNLGFKLTNLNGEVSAQSIFGPFRIEGNYLKGNTPEGFAITIGKISDSYPTTLNAVVSHPQSNSYVRFDGTFNLDNKVLNGAVIVESQKMSDFVNDNISVVKLPNEYNNPVAVGFDVNLNSQNLSLSNVVVKYGDTQGAGALKVSLQDDETREVEADFEFADLELKPFVEIVQNFIEKYREEAYQPDYNIDLTANMSALRASYKGQGIKNLQLDLSVADDIIAVDNLKAVLPGDTSLKMTGNVYGYEGQVYYQGQVEVNANDLIKTLNWLDIKPEINTTSVYKKMLMTGNVSGNFEKIKVSPYKVTMDKSTLTGELGVVLGNRTDVMLVANADTINFDNYISSLSETEKNKTWGERMTYRFAKLGFLNDLDMVLNAKADLLIYEEMPFEKVDIKASLLNGNMDIDYLKIEQVANTALELKGKLKGFGGVPQTDGLQYEIKSTDLASLINKLELKVPNLDYKKFNNLAMSGAINGNKDSFGINTSVTVGTLNGLYKGKVENINDVYNFDGELEVKHPDFVKLLHNIKAGYQPEAGNLGLFSLKTNVKGNATGMEFKDVVGNIGYTSFSGTIDYEKVERPSFMGDIKINKFEIDKFLVKSKKNAMIGEQVDAGVGAFLHKPYWSKDKIDYIPYKSIDVKAAIEVGELSYKGTMFNDSKFKLEAVGDKVNINEFTANYKNAPLNGSLLLDMGKDPTIVVNGNLADANVTDFDIGGRVYNIRGGKFSTRFDFSSKANSEYDFAENLKGKAELKVVSTDVNGINLQAIYDDLVKRQKSDGLVEKIKSYIGSGKTAFDKVSGRAIFDKGNYSLADVEMTGSNVKIKAYGEGNVAEWNMNVVFNTKFNEPKYLPEFSFSLRNSMADPTLDVNVSSLFKMYKAQEDQKIAAKKAEIEAEKKYWDDLANEQKKIADGLVLSTREKLQQQVKDAEVAAYSQDSVGQYNLLQQDIDKVLSDLVEAMDITETTKIDDAVLKNMVDANKTAVGNIERYAEKFAEIQLTDLKKKNAAEYNKIVEMFNQTKQDIFSYNSDIDKYKERLANVITDYKLEEDADFMSKKQAVDEKIAMLESLNTEAINAQNLRKEDANIDEYVAYNKKLADVLDKMSIGKNELKQVVDAMKVYAEPKIGEVEKVYAKQVEDEENQRRLEENTGSISIKKTGKTLTVTRDIEAIKSAEEEVNKEGVRVLDFSKEKVEVKEKDNTLSGNVIKKGRNIRIN